MTRADSQVVVSVRGEIDVASAPAFWDRLAEAITETNRLVLDLSETEFIDSTALAVMVRALKRLRHSGGDLVIRSPRANASKVLHVTGLDRVITIEA